MNNNAFKQIYGTWFLSYCIGLLLSFCVYFSPKQIKRVFETALSENMAPVTILLGQCVLEIVFVVFYFTLIFKSYNKQIVNLLDHIVYWFTSLVVAFLGIKLGMYFFNLNSREFLFVCVFFGAISIRNFNYLKLTNLDRDYKSHWLFDFGKGLSTVGVALITFLFACAAESSPTKFFMGNVEGAIIDFLSYVK